MIYLLAKDYDADSLCDIGRDVMEALDPRFNNENKDIPVDEWGVPSGTFELTLTWSLDEDE